jgi:hypothetical protein
MIFGCSISTTQLVQSKTHWGGTTHSDIIRNAIFSLPSPWKEFFNDYSLFLKDHSNDPDQYRSWCSYNDANLYAAEGPRHYDDHNIKVDGGEVYNESTPQYAHLIDSQYTSEDYEFVSVDDPVSSSKYKKGVIEWTVSNFTQILTYYMSIASENPSNNTVWQLILTSMSWLCHYVADATMPFHATANYDGQLTEQNGIHSAVESYLIPSFSREISFSHNQASYTPSAFNQTIFSIESGLALVSQILEFDNELAPDGNRDNDWSESMWDGLHDELSGRVDLASRYTANLWYTSLIDSGLITRLNSTDLNLISIGLSEIPDPWRPKIPSNTSVTTTTSSTTAPTNNSSTSTATTSQEITSWRLFPLFFLISLCFLVKRRKMRKRKLL